MLLPNGILVFLPKGGGHLLTLSTQRWSSVYLSLVPYSASLLQLLYSGTFITDCPVLLDPERTATIHGFWKVSLLGGAADDSLRSSCQQTLN